MEFTLETCVDFKTMKTLAMGIRKIFRAEKTKIAGLLAAGMVALGGLLVFNPKVHPVSAVMAAIAISCFVAALLFGDAITAFLVTRKKVPGMEKTVTTFREDGYRSVSGLGEADFSYGDVFVLAEHRDYFLLLINPQYGQIYAKASIQGGTAEEFRRFLQEKTGLTIQDI